METITFVLGVIGVGAAIASIILDFYGLTPEQRKEISEDVEVIKEFLKRSNNSNDSDDSIA